MSIMVACLVLLLTWGLALKGNWPDSSRRQLLWSKNCASYSELDIEVLMQVGGCDPPIRFSFRAPPLPYLLSWQALRSSHLFLGDVPWWSALLCKGRVWLLWGKDSESSLHRAGRILCRTPHELKTIRRLMREKGLKAAYDNVGFTAVAERRPSLSAPVAGNPKLSVLYAGDPLQAQATQASWAQDPKLPPLIVPGPNEALWDMMPQYPIHLHQETIESFDYRLQRSRFLGALHVSEGNGLLDSVNELVALTIDARTAKGLENQNLFSEAHESFRKEFPQRQPEVFFFGGRLPAETGGQIYDNHMVEELRRQHIDVLQVDLGDFRKFAGLGGWEAIPLAVALVCILSFRRQAWIVDQNYSDWLGPAMLVRKLLGRGKQVLLVHHMNRYQSAHSSQYRKWAHKLQARPADLVITVSQFCKEEVQTLGVDGSKIEIICGGMDRDRLTAPPNEKLVSAGPIQLLFVGQCVARKGLVSLLQALSQFESSDFLLRLVGDKETSHFKNEIAPLIEELDIGDRVIAEGRVSGARLSECYQESDLFVFPSYIEGYGLAVAEAMYSGLPVLCSGASALPELVEDGRHGYLFKAGEPKDIAAALRRVLAAPQELVTMGRAAHERALREPTWAQSRERFFDAIDPLLAW